MGTSQRFGQIVLSVGILLLMIAYMAIPVTAAGKDDITYHLKKYITAFQKEVEAAQKKLEGVKINKEFHRSPTRIRFKTARMQRCASSLSRTVEEAKTKCRGCKAATALEKAVKDLGTAIEDLKTKPKPGSKAPAEKILTKMSDTLEGMEKHVKILSVGLRKMMLSKPGLKKSPSKMKPGGKQPKPVAKPGS